MSKVIPGLGPHIVGFGLNGVGINVLENEEKGRSGDKGEAGTEY